MDTRGKAAGSVKLFIAEVKNDLEQQFERRPKLRSVRSRSASQAIRDAEGAALG
jgi:hypothetical protein